MGGREPDCFSNWPIRYFTGPDNCETPRLRTNIHNVVTAAVKDNCGCSAKCLQKF